MNKWLMVTVDASHKVFLGTKIINDPRIEVSKNFTIWLVVSTPLKNISQWEGLSHILWKIKNVPNHQPDKVERESLTLCFFKRSIRRKTGEHRGPRGLDPPRNMPEINSWAWVKPLCALRFKELAWSIPRWYCTLSG